MPEHGGQHLFLLLEIVSQNDVRKEGAAVAQQHGRLPGGLAGIVEPLPR